MLHLTISYSSTINMKSFCIILLTVAAAQAAVKQVANVGLKKYFVDANLTPDSPHLTWEKALDFCQQNQMTLATINNQAEQDALDQWRRTFRTYIGATNDKDDEQKWIWERTGKPVTFSNWGESEGNGYYGKNTCSSMIGAKREDGKPHLIARPPQPVHGDGFDEEPLPKHGDWQATSCDIDIGQALCE